jgi:hypothetical protein
MGALLIIGLVVVVLALQFRMGAYRVERGVYSDDAAHFMNGLLIRDYLRSPIGTNPMRFAEQYYLHYPKIAPLMWPPLFHVVLGISLLPGLPAFPTALLLVGLCAAWTAWRLFGIVRELSGSIFAGHAVMRVSSCSLQTTAEDVDRSADPIIACHHEAAGRLALQSLDLASRRVAVWRVYRACAADQGNGVAVLMLPQSSVW